LGLIGGVQRAIPEDYVTASVKASVRECRKPGEKLINNVAGILFLFVSKVEAEVYQICLSGLAQCHDVLYDCGTSSQQHEFSKSATIEGK
jgi:hypothetical protein